MTDDRLKKLYVIALGMNDTPMLHEVLDALIECQARQRRTEHALEAAQEDAMGTHPYNDCEKCKLQSDSEWIADRRKELGLAL